jgi:CheY-like chemotaxis protein
MSNDERLRILVVDDDPDLRGAIVAALVAAGHEVQDASNGAVGLEKALLARPDVVVTDYIMPVASGGALIESLRMLMRPPPSLVAISAYPGAAQWCAENGVEVFLAKPFMRESLLNAVEYAGRRLRESPPTSGSGLHRTVRSACVMAVGDAAEDLESSLPTAIRHARVVVVDSPDEAMQILQQLIPELVVVSDNPEHLGVKLYAESHGIPCVTREKDRTARHPHAHVA